MFSFAFSVDVIATDGCLVKIVNKNYDYIFEQRSIECVKGCYSHKMSPKHKSANTFSKT